MTAQVHTQSFPVNGHHKKLVLMDVPQAAIPEDISYPEFQAIGFRFVRYFLLVILGVVGSMIGSIGFLGWHLGMDITVEGQGLIEPTVRYEVKVQRSGLIQKVYVHHEQQVEQGDLMLTLDDTDLRSEMEQIEQELVMNQSRRVALGAELERERAVLETDVTRAEVAYETVLLQLEQVQKEYQVYHKYSPYRLDGSVRPVLDALMPIRLHQTRVHRAEVDIEYAKRRLNALDSREQELSSLTQIYEKLQMDRHLIQAHLENLKVYAPVAGTVLTRDLDKRVGDRLQAGDAIVELAELDGWQAEVMIQEVDLPKVNVGQVVRLYVNAFPHMTYKVFEGVVTDVPSKPELVKSAEAGVGFGGMRRVYPVKVRVIDPYVSDGEKVYSLAYGMGVDAKIVTERGPIVDLIWKKFLKTVGKVGRPEIYRLTDGIDQTVN
jgi:multidrug resistance efflux pump